MGGNLPVMAKYTQDQVDRWVAAHKQGKSLRAISESEGVPFPTIAWKMRTLGHRRRPGRPSKHEGKSSSQVNRERNLRQLYGMSIGDYDSLFEAQGGLCAICRRPAQGGRTASSRLNVDHDHATGKIRGLLCVECNVSLGKFKDDPKLLRAAADYLEKNRE